MQYSGHIPLQPPERRARDIAACGPDNLTGKDGLEEFPASAGAYLLLVGLREAFEFPFRHTAPLTFQPGWYVYAGSARGPGGIRARLARHFRPDKRPHWHIDRLTLLPHARVLACAASGAGECDLVARLSRTGRFHVPCPGFGSSDCRRCDSHLLMWTE